MDSIRNYVILGAMLGSVFVATFAYKVTAHVVFAAEPVNLPETAAAGNQEISSSVQSDSQSQGQTNPQSKPEKAEKNSKAQKCLVSEKYPETIRQWCGQITSFSKKKKLDPDLIAALIWQESGGNPGAYSKSGAVGLMQVMPRDGLAAAFTCANGPCFANRPSTQELQDPNFNVDYGTGMLSGLVAKHGDVREALRSYGPMDVGYYYADKVLGIYQTYKK